jgi:hypothetical protein
MYFSNCSLAVTIAETGPMKPECIPEIRGKAAREFEAKIRQGPTVQQRWVLQEAIRTYKKVKLEK